MSIFFIQEYYEISNQLACCIHRIHELSPDESARSILEEYLIPTSEGIENPDNRISVDYCTNARRETRCTPYIATLIDVDIASLEICKCWSSISENIPLIGISEKCTLDISFYTIRDDSCPSIDRLSNHSHWSISSKISKNIRHTHSGTTTKCY